jgi:superfamily II DNA or RNA helicase
MLRPYQTSLLRAIPSGEGARTCLQLATGAGKTRIALEWLRQCQHTPAQPAWFICHRIELLDQTVAAFIKAGFDPGRICAGEDFDRSKSVFVCTIQTLNVRNIPVSPGFIVVDECHHVAADSWARLLACYPKAVVLGLTATPMRADGRALGDFFGTLICGPSMRELITQEFLSEYQYYLGVEPVLDDIEILGGDYNARQSAAVMQDVLLIARPWDQFKAHNLRGPAIAFCPTIKTSKMVAARFAEHGISAAHIDFETPSQERKELFARWQSGDIKLLSNVSLFGEGIDAVSCDAVFLLRPTKSLGLFRQMIGRGLRKHGETVLRIYDHASNVIEHGSPEREIAWSLDGKVERASAHDLEFCAECGCQMQGGHCPHCGKTQPGASRSRMIRCCGGTVQKLVQPAGCISIGEYAEAQRKTPATVRKWIAKGMPLRDGWIDAITADPWVATRNEAWRKNARGWVITRAMQAKHNA